MTRKEYEEIIQLDLAWLSEAIDNDRSPHCAEAEHIELVLRESIDLKYPKPVDVQVPVWLAGNGFRGEWIDYLAIRKEKKATIGERWQARAFKRLEKLSKGDAETASLIVAQSADAGWLGLFPLKGEYRARNW